MIILRNEVTGKNLKLTDSVAKGVFGITGQDNAYLLCLPARHIFPAKGAQNVQVVKERKRRKKIGGACVVRMGGLGDLIMLSSSLAKMKKKNPDSPLTLATIPRYVPIMKDLKGVDLCIPIEDMSKYSFDKVLDLRYAVEPSNIGPGSLSWRKYVQNDRSDNFDELCGVNSRGKYFNVPVDKEIRKTIIKRKIVKGKIKIGLCPTTASPVRVIPPEYVAPLTRMLEGLGHVHLIGKTEEWNSDLSKISGGCVVNLLDRTDDKELIAACSMMDLIISPDTGVLHIAGALKKKAIGLFANINPDTRIKYYKNMTSIYPVCEMACVPCHDVPGACDCETPGAPCMRWITPERILVAAKARLR